MGTKIVKNIKLFSFILVSFSLMSITLAIHSAAARRFDYIVDHKGQQHFVDLDVRLLSKKERDEAAYNLSKTAHEVIMAQIYARKPVICRSYKIMDVINGKTIIVTVVPSLNDADFSGEDEIINANFEDVELEG